MTKRWREEDAAAAIEEVKAGETVVRVVAKYGVPERTLRRKLQRCRAGQVDKKPGPQPILGSSQEADLYQWVIGMQREGFTVTRDMLLIKANEIYHVIFGNLRSSGSIGRG